jgi:hypothetical protein
MAVDKTTQDSINATKQQMENQAALAKASTEAMDLQGRLELEKSLHEMKAKSTKGMGESLKGLA